MRIDRIDLKVNVYGGTRSRGPALLASSLPLVALPPVPLRALLAGFGITLPATA